jgi:hypothetical protein
MPGKMAGSAPRPTVGLSKVPVAVCTSRRSCRKGRKSANIHARSAVIRGIPVKDGEILKSAPGATVTQRLALARRGKRDARRSTSRTDASAHHDRHRTSFGDYSIM